MRRRRASGRKPRNDTAGRAAPHPAGGGVWIDTEGGACSGAGDGVVRPRTSDLHAARRTTVGDADRSRRGRTPTVPTNDRQRAWPVPAPSPRLRPPWPRSLAPQHGRIRRTCPCSRRCGIPTNPASAATEQVAQVRVWCCKLRPWVLRRSPLPNARTGVVWLCLPPNVGTPSGKGAAPARRETRRNEPGWRGVVPRPTARRRPGSPSAAHAGVGRHRGPRLAG